MISRIQNNTELYTYLEKFFGAELQSFLQSPAEPKTIRTNTLKSDQAQIRNLLQKLDIAFRPVEFNPHGLIIESEDAPLGHTLAFFCGDFFHQGIASQLPVILLNPCPGERILDIAASPGSKSAQMAAAMKNSGELVLNDPSSARMQPLNVNMQRSGATNYYIIQQRGERLGVRYPGYFDKVLVDAPCSALGTLAGNAEIAGWWSNKKISKLANIQYHLIVSGLKALKTGGELVYATCSVAPEENEILIDRLLKEYPVAISAPPENLRRLFDAGITGYKGEKLDLQLSNALRTFPQRHGMEGFFVVKIKKNKEFSRESKTSAQKLIKTLTHLDGGVAGILEQISSYWGISGRIWQNYRYLLTTSRIWMVNRDLQEVAADNFISCGLLLGEKRIEGTKLGNSSIQVLSGMVKKRRIQLSDTRMKSLFARGELDYGDAENGYYALEYNNRAIASVYIKDKKMRIRLPHAFRLQL